MNARVVNTVFRKEVAETLRDRRTLIMMVFVPIVLYPALLLLVVQVASVQQSRIAAEDSRVALGGGAAPEALRERLGAAERVRLVGLEEEPRAALLARRVDVVVDLGAEFAERVGGGSTASVRVLLDETNDRAELARKRVLGVLSAYGEALLSERLEALVVTADYVEPLATAVENVAPPARMGGHFLGRVLPMLLVLTVIMGAFYPAVDLTAGEKERGTLQTLLTAPLTPLEIVAGKFLAVCAISLVAGTVNVGSMALVFSHALALEPGAAVELELSLGVPSVALLLLVVFAMGLFFSALMMTVAVLARSFKEAQNLLTPVYLVCLVPAILTQLPGVELSAGTALVPAVNVALLVKAILQGDASVQAAFLVVGSSAVYTLLLLTGAARLFQRETVLVGTEAPLRALLARDERAPVARRRPTVGEALFLFAGLFVLLYYLGAMAQAWHLLVGVLVTLWGLLALPTLGFARLRGLPLRETFALRRPGARATLAAALLGLGAWAVVGALVEPLQSRFLPMPQELVETMEALLAAPEGAGGVILLYVAVALSPGVCEELVFRGFLLSAFRGPLPRWGAVVLSALLFGIFHLSVYRLLGTFALGLVAGLLVVRSGSILPAMVFHALNNAVLLGLSNLPESWGVSSADAVAPAGPVLLVAGVLFLAGLALLLPAGGLRRGPRSPQSPRTPRA